MLRYLDLSRLISTFPDLSRLFHLLISATILENSDNADYPGTQKVGKNWEIRKSRDDFPIFPYFSQHWSQFVSVEIPTVSTRPEFLLRPSRPDPDLSQSRGRPSRSRSRTNPLEISCPQFLARFSTEVVNNRISFSAHDRIRLLWKSDNSWRASEARLRGRPCPRSSWSR